MVELAALRAQRSSDKEKAARWQWNVRRSQQSQRDFVRQGPRSTQICGNLDNADVLCRTAIWYILSREKQVAASIGVAIRVLHMEQHNGWAHEHRKAGQATMRIKWISALPSRIIGSALEAASISPRAGPSSTSLAWKTSACGLQTRQRPCTCATQGCLVQRHSNTWAADQALS